MDLPVIIVLAFIGLLGVLCQWFAWRVQIPSILFLLLLGLLLGPVGGVINPDELFGDLLFPFVSLSVAVILFEGSLTLKAQDITGLTKVVRNLLTIGLLVTWLSITVATHWLIGLPWNLSFVFGALVVVTGPTVIVPLLRTVRPRASIANILRWEGIMIDPVGAVLAVLVFDFMISDQSSALESVMQAFTGIVLTGLLIGLVTAELLGQILRRRLLPEYLQNIFVLTLVVSVFAISDSLTHESGLLAVTVMGIRLANMRGIDIERILDFKESLSLLLISTTFIVLAARLELDQFTAMGWPALALLGVIMLVVRPVAVAVSTIGSDLSLRERALLAWISPRGIVAAAVSALFALRLEASGYPEAWLLVPLTFSTIIGTVLIQSLTARPLANALGVSEPEPHGVLLVSGSTVSVAIGKALSEQGIDVLLADSSWDQISSARMAGMRTFYGNAISEHADRHMDIIGIGRMLALSPRAEFNALACKRFAPELGQDRVYELAQATENDMRTKHRVSERHGGRQLFGKGITYRLLASKLAQGGEIKATQLSDNFTMEDYLARHGKRVTPLFALDSNRLVRVFTVDRRPETRPGWVVIGLITAEKAETEENKQLKQ